MSFRLPNNEVFLPSGFHPSGICSNALNLKPYGIDNFEISFFIKSYCSGLTHDVVIPNKLNFDRYFATSINFSPDEAGLYFLNANQLLHFCLMA